MSDMNCWFCGKPGAKKREYANGKFYREPACDDCFADMKRSGYPVKDDTKPLPAQELLKLADEMAVQIITHDHTQMNWTAVVRSVQAYRAARAASPVTLEEALMIDEALTWHEYMKPKDASDPERAKRANDAWFARTEHARRLAGEGGDNG